MNWTTMKTKPSINHDATVSAYVIKSKIELFEANKCKFKKKKLSMCYKSTDNKDR